MDQRDPRDSSEPPQWWRRAGDARLQSMFDTRTDAWRAVGLQDEVRQRDSRRARRQTLVLLALLAAVMAAYALRDQLFGASAETPVPSFDVRVRLPSGMHPSRVQAVLDETLTTPTRDPATVLLEELDGDEVVVRIQGHARAGDGRRPAGRRGRGRLDRGRLVGRAGEVSPGVQDQGISRARRGGVESII